MIVISYGIVLYRVRWGTRHKFNQKSKSINHHLPIFYYVSVSQNRNEFSPKIKVLFISTYMLVCRIVIDSDPIVPEPFPHPQSLLPLAYITGRMSSKITVLHQRVSGNTYVNKFCPPSILNRLFLIKCFTLTSTKQK